MVAVLRRCGDRSFIFDSHAGPVRDPFFQETEEEGVCCPDHHIAHRLSILRMGDCIHQGMEWYGIHSIRRDHPGDRCAFLRGSRRIQNDGLQ